MILSNSRSPHKSLYVIGANLISTIQAYQFFEISPLELFKKYNESYEKISFAYFSFGLSWLFITEVIELTGSGDIKLCN